MDRVVIGDEIQSMLTRKLALRSTGMIMNITKYIKKYGTVFF